MLGDGHALDDPRTPERRGRHRHIGRDCRTAGTTTGSSSALRLAAIRRERSWRALRSAIFSRAAIASGLSGRAPAALDAHDLVHQAQALERVAGVVHLADIRLREVSSRHGDQAGMAPPSSTG